MNLQREKRRLERFTKGGKEARDLQKRGKEARWIYKGRKVGLKDLHREERRLGGSKKGGKEARWIYIGRKGGYVDLQRED